MTDLPNEYIPEVIRLKQRRELAYGIGMSTDKRSFSMTYGPTKNLIEMLDIVPTKDAGRIKSYIIRFNVDGTDDVLYEWNRNKWVKCL